MMYLDFLDASPTGHIWNKTYLLNIVDICLVSFLVCLLLRENRIKIEVYKTKLFGLEK